MRKLTRAALVGAVTVAAVAATAVPASAAFGRIYFRVGTLWVATANPAAGCHGVDNGPITALRNETNVAVRLYRGTWCTGTPVATVPPGGYTTTPSDSFYVPS
ncbi:hypothetical protein Val02_23020 [Virgisporangium aliadipatigenens]|uniref:Secreted protein n=1 Tax=Virgisporangium aliadipatigenens TaxID=741659 RepID=A0A8J4DPZ2_9ACTN|nr:hypothetical protein [Virgisporangium aliadipatigenens]GIJ45416.1 hypothetical protein Val02_23020 [Virgisporangium aliadipatigenens]